MIYSNSFILQKHFCAGHAINQNQFEQLFGVNYTKGTTKLLTATWAIFLKPDIN